MLDSKDPGTQPTEGKNVRVLAYILSLLLATVITVGGTVLISLQSPHVPDGLLLLAIAALSVLVYGPLVLGSLTASWDVARTPESRGAYRRWLWAVTGLELFGMIAIIVYAVSVRAPWWIPVVSIAGAVTLAALGVMVGRYLLRYEEAHPRPSSWALVTRGEIRRKIAIVSVTFVGVFVLAVVVITIFGAGVEARTRTGLLLYGLGFALFAAGFACILVALPLNRRLRDAVGRSLGLQRKVARVVLANKRIDLDESEQAAAMKYAAVAPTVLGFTLAYLVLLYLGLGIEQLIQLSSGEGNPFTIGISVFLVAALAVFVPINLVRIRRARQYARSEPRTEPGSLCDL